MTLTDQLESEAAMTGRRLTTMRDHIRPRSVGESIGGHWPSGDFFIEVNDYDVAALNLTVSLRP